MGWIFFAQELGKEWRGQQELTADGADNADRSARGERQTGGLINRRERSATKQQPERMEDIGEPATLVLGRAVARRRSPLLSPSTASRRVNADTTPDDRAKRSDCGPKTCSRSRANQSELMLYN